MKWAFSILAILLVTGCATPTQNGDFRLRVMTYNIHHGEGIDGKVDLQRIARLITENKVDLVALQEVDSQTKRTGRRDFPAEFSALTGITNVFGPNIEFEGGYYGNAILSRHPILYATNHFLPQVNPSEQRGLLQTTIRLPFGDLTFCSVHLDHRKDEAERLAGVSRIHQILSNNPAPMQIVAGDFNARPNSQTVSNMTRIYVDSWSITGKGDGFTIPSEKPNARIDYVFSKGILASSAKTLASNASDHLPLIVDFEILVTTPCVCFAPPVEEPENKAIRLRRESR